MTTSDETMPVFQAPAASLLFQAPAFQEPAFIAPAPAEEPPAPARRRKRSEEAAPSEATETAPARRRSRSRKAEAAAQAEAAPEVAETSPAAAGSADDEESQEGAKPRKRARRSSRRTSEEGTAEAEESSSPESGTEEEADTSADEEDGTGTTRRRRRRRSRSTSGEGTTSDDEVKALKGSTRLEAKKQRRREGRKEGRRRHVITESEFLARRESVTRRMVIRHQDGLDQIAILEDDLLVEHYVARRTQQSMVGNIYLGRVQNVLPSMEAAFVDIGRGRNAVLYAGEVNWDAVGLEGRPRRIESALKSGDPVLVQVTKDPIGHKGARLTSQITLAGRYLVLIPGGSMMGISRKLPDTERTRLKKILKKVVPAGSGVIVRTAAEGATEEQLSDDVARLVKQWGDIERKKENTRSAPTLLRGEPELAVRVVRDIFNEDFTSLVIQGRETYQTIKDYVDELSPELSDRVEQWVGTDDVFHANRVDEQLAKGMDRKVWLPSGGTLIIDRTEAMTVIDVNTGKFIGAGGTLEETVTRNNLEAAEEIVRQLRLRDIGGIVIIDFVDMVLEQNRDLVLRRLVECLGRDRTRHQVTEITSLGLVQMTRKRVGEGLVEAFSTTCEACEGRGFIVHHHPVETSGASGSSSKSRKKKSAPVEEPRRIEDGPERERAREALSAIAAASAHAKSDPSTSGDEVNDEAGSPAPDVSAEVGPSGTDTGVNAAAASDPVDAEKPARGRRRAAKAETEEAKPRRRRASRKAEAAEVEPPVVELPAPVTSSDTEDSASSTVTEEASTRPARRRAVRSTQEIVLPERAPETEAAPKARSRRRRAVATSDVVEPASVPASSAVESSSASAPVTTAGSAQVVAPSDEGSAAPRKRRRRAVSTGVVEA